MPVFVPSFLSCYQSVATGSGHRERHVCIVQSRKHPCRSPFIPPIHSQSSAMSKLHNLPSTGAGLSLCTCVCAFACSSASVRYKAYPEIRSNLANAILTGLSSDDTGCLFPPLHLMFHLSPRPHSSAALMHV